MIYDLNDARLAKAGPAADSEVPDLDQIEDVTDYSRQTLEHLKLRIENSEGVEQFVYREMELDVVWRLIDCAVGEARRGVSEPGNVGTLVALRAAVIEAHDLLGVDRASAAASRLGAVLV